MQEFIHCLFDLYHPIFIRGDLANRPLRDIDIDKKLEKIKSGQPKFLSRIKYKSMESQERFFGMKKSNLSGNAKLDRLVEQFLLELNLKRGSHF